MKHHKYLIVGGGMTADSAVRGIRKIDQSGTIAMICDERHLPYDRPPLSKSLWKDKPFESIWRDTGNLNVAMHLGKKVVALSTLRRRLQLTMLETSTLMTNFCLPRVVQHGACPLPMQA